MGVALESRRLDKLEEVITKSTDMVKALKYALKVCQNLVINRDFRQQVRINHACCIAWVVLYMVGGHGMAGCLHGTHGMGKIKAWVIRHAGRVQYEALVLVHGI